MSSRSGRRPKQLSPHKKSRAHNLIVKYTPISKTARVAKKMWNNKHDSLYLGRKYARIFVLGHYLFLEAHSFP